MAVFGRFFADTLQKRYTTNLRGHYVDQLSYGPLDGVSDDVGSNMASYRSSSRTASFEHSLFVRAVEKTKYYYINWILQQLYKYRFVYLLRFCIKTIQ